MSDAINALINGEKIDECLQTYIQWLNPSLRHEMECDNNDELQS